MTANVFHPGDVKTEMWADIRDQPAALGPVADDYARWVAWVEETGGDPPEKAADLVLRVVGDDAARERPVPLDRGRRSRHPSRAGSSQGRAALVGRTSVWRLPGSGRRPATTV